MDAPVPELEARAVACAEALLDTDRVLLASHIDAGGAGQAVGVDVGGQQHAVGLEQRLGARDGAGLQLGDGSVHRA